MLEDDVLHRTIRQLLASGRLPRTPPERVWGGAGVGAKCAVCARRVGPEELEFELDFGAGADGSSLHVHMRCFHAWERELADPLSGTSERGTLPGAQHGSAEGRS